MAAEVACDQMKVQSQNDRVQLDKAKEMTYLKGFYEGVSTCSLLVIFDKFWLKTLYYSTGSLARFLSNFKNS